jgi:PKD repeat protein
MKAFHIILTMFLLLIVGTVSAVTIIPSCDFTSNVQSGPEDLTVTFTATYQGITPPVSYSWDFGDNSGAEKLSGTTVTHTYTSPGKYSVRLAVNDLGVPTTWWVSNTKTDYINVLHVPPVAGFTFTPASGNAPLNVSFTSTTTGDDYTLVWGFGDGTQSTDTNPVHTFTMAGNYFIILNATNDGGSTGSIQSVDVYPAAPRADFTASSATTGAKPFAVAFEDATAYDGTITGWTWNFGDGGSATTQNSIHTYTTVGTYNVSLTVDSISGSDSVTKASFVTVLEKPVVCPTPTPTPVPTPTPEPTVATDDVGIFRPSTGYWYLDADGNRQWDVMARFGGVGDIPVPADYAGDGYKDIAIFRPATGVWYIDTNHDGNVDIAERFGGANDVPMPADYNGDGNADIAIFRPASGMWYVDTNHDNTIDISFRYGGAGDTPLTGNWYPISIVSSPKPN